MEHEKKGYAAPQLIDYGTVSEITGVVGNFARDVPNGPNDTAYS